MYLVGKAPGIPSTYKLVFIIVVILQSEIVQVVNLVQVDPNKMAAARVAMVIVVDDVLLENPYCYCIPSPTHSNQLGNICTTIS